MPEWSTKPKITGSNPVSGALEVTRCRAQGGDRARLIARRVMDERLCGPAFS